MKRPKTFPSSLPPLPTCNTHRTIDYLPLKFVYTNQWTYYMLTYTCFCMTYNRSSLNFHWCTTKLNFTISIYHQFFFVLKWKSWNSKRLADSREVTQCCQQCCVLANICGSCFISFKNFYPVLSFNFSYWGYVPGNNAWHTSSGMHTTVWQIIPQSINWHESCYKYIGKKVVLKKL